MKGTDSESQRTDGTVVAEGSKTSRRLFAQCLLYLLRLSSIASLIAHCYKGTISPHREAATNLGNTVRRAVSFEASRACQAIRLEVLGHSPVPGKVDCHCVQAELVQCDRIFEQRQRLADAFS